MADKYIKQENGALKEVEATVTSTGSSEAGDVVALDAQGKIDQSLLPPGIGADTFSVVAYEDLSAGDFVNIYDNSGTSNCRKADATTAGKEAHGFVLEAVTAAAVATIYREGTNNQVTGLSVGMQYLDTTAGACTNTPPSASGNIVQRLGVAISATEMNVEFAQPIELA